MREVFYSYSTLIYAFSHQILKSISWNSTPSIICYLKKTIKNLHSVRDLNKKSPS